MRYGTHGERQGLVLAIVVGVPGVEVPVRVPATARQLSGLPEVLHVTPWQPAGCACDAAVLSICALVGPRNRYVAR